MAKPGSGKRKMANFEKRQWRQTTKSLRSTGRSISSGWKKGKRRAKKACYVATCVYGSYDCPEVCVLRRFRDRSLASTLFGRIFIKLYYAISPTAVKVFGRNKFVRNIWKKWLDRLVLRLRASGYSDDLYDDSL